MAVVIGVLVWLNVSDDDPEEGAAPSDATSPSTEAAPAAPAEGVFVVDVAGGAGGIFLTPGSGPVWSPDGSQLAFSSEEEGETGVYVVDAAGGSGGTFLTPGSGPVWSPDGSQLAFSSEEEGE